MTTLYRPVLIESADLPMDKFPEGTIATHPDYWPVERCSCSRWEGEGEDRYNPDMVGWTALVPIEAEEVWSARQPHPGGGTRGRTNFGVHESKARHHCETVAGDVVERRLVTPWEPA